MATAVFRGRYSDEPTILRELRKIFPTGIVSVMHERGRFLCTIPDDLTEDQVQTMKNALAADHYED